MIRTQIYLTDELYHRLFILKQRRQESFAQIIRETLEKHLPSEKELNVNPLSSLAELKIKGGPKDASKNFRKYLYRTDE